MPATPCKSESTTRSPHVTNRLATEHGLPSILHPVNRVPSPWTAAKHTRGNQLVAATLWRVSSGGLCLPRPGTCLNRKVPGFERLHLYLQSCAIHGRPDNYTTAISYPCCYTTPVNTSYSMDSINTLDRTVVPAGTALSAHQWTMLYFLILPRTSKMLVHTIRYK